MRDSLTRKERTITAYKHTSYEAVKPEFNFVHQTQNSDGKYQ